MGMNCPFFYGSQHKLKMEILSVSSVFLFLTLTKVNPLDEISQSFTN